LGTSNGNGCLSLLDRNGALRDSICTSSDLVSTGFATFDTSGIERSAEGVNENNTGGFIDYDQSGSARAFIGNFAFENQSGAFAYDPTGAAYTGVNVDPVNGSASFLVDIANTGAGSGVYNNRIVLGTRGSDVTAPETEHLYLIDPNGVYRERLVVDDLSSGIDTEQLSFANASNNSVGNFYSPADGGGSYNTFDQNGNPTASLP
jgi:hypothetical protein